ncbi:Rhs-family protein [Photobacterium aphoticum]|uniref:Rhs-family protein n=1 Tax=Photobacterium aphoticum TaxID=754436 RepID=A0A090QRW4_9GAMM|nr:Rhs-family protein [Photobacterium aphoticum]
MHSSSGHDLSALFDWADAYIHGGEKRNDSLSTDVLRETLAQYVFSNTLSVQKIPPVSPTVIPSSGSSESINKICPPHLKNVKPVAITTASETNIIDESIAVSPQMMAYEGKVVSMATGEVMMTCTDVILPGAFPLTWQRIYRSQRSQQNIGLGYGWRSNFHYELATEVEESTGKKRWVFVDCYGDVLHFHDVPSGEVCYHTRAGASFYHDPQGTYRITLRSGQQMRFRRQGEHWVMDRLRKNSMLQYQLQYSKGRRLIGIVANGGLQLGLSYDCGGYLREVQIQGSDTSRTLRTAVLAHYHYSGEGELSEVSNRQQQVERYRYHQHLLVQRTYASGCQQGFEWQGEGSIAQCVAVWGDEGLPTYRFRYDDDKHTAICIDSEQNEWVYQHDDMGLFVSKTSPMGHVWQYQYDDFGRKDAVITPNGGITRYRYNLLGQLSEICEPNKAVTQFYYNRLGLVTRYIDREGREWLYDYDSFGCLLSQHCPSGLVKAYQYDRHGRLQSVEHTDGFQRRYWWNASGLLTAQQHGEWITRYSYDESGELNGVIQGNNRVTQYERDRSGQIVTIIEYPQDQPELAQTYRLTYDWAGRPITLTDPHGQITTLAYNAVGSLQHYQCEGEKSLSLHYDRRQNLSQIQVGDSVTYNLCYNADSVLENIKESGGRTLHYQYDGMGKLINVAEGNKRFISFFRDPCGGVLESRSCVSGSTQSNYYHYDLLGRLQHANNAQRKVNLCYHLNGQVTEIRQDNWLITHHYDDTGQRTMTTLPDGEAVTYQYGASGCLGSLTWRQQTLHVSNSLCDTPSRDDFSQAYDPVLAQWDRQKWQPDLAPHLPMSLISLLPQDVLFSRANEDIASADFEGFIKGILYLSRSLSAHQSLQSYGDSEDDTDVCRYVYDEFQNQIKKHSSYGGEQRRFNGLNQLISFKKAGKYTQYHYDALGRRSAKISEGQQIDFLWDGEQLIGEHCSGKLTWYFYPPGSYQPLAMVTNGELYRYNDGHITPLTPEGAYCDEESGLYYQQFRYDDPHTDISIHQEAMVY